MVNTYLFICKTRLDETEEMIAQLSDLDDEEDIL